MRNIRAVIFDLDGVVRHFEQPGATEHRLGLPPGSIEAAAFASGLIDDATTGRITFEAWMDAMADALERDHGASARAAAAAWAALPTWLDDDVVTLAHTLRAAGYATAILTNGTTRVEHECALLGLPGDAFAHLFNSARIGYAKPDRRVFEHVVGELGVAPEECAFTDDSKMKLAGAVELGMATHHYTGVAPLHAWLRDDLGLTC
jgi:putative hydrolase of the HAD superfamily